MADWFYRTKSGEEGPFRPSDLTNLAQQGVIRPETPLRRSDSDQWVPARRLKGLFPPPAQSIEQPSTVNHSSTKLKRGMIAAGSVIVVIILGLLVLPTFTPADRIPPSSESLTQKAIEPIQPAFEPTASTPTKTQREPAAAAPANFPVAESETMKALGRSRLKAEEVVKLYLAAKTWDERFPLMTNVRRKPQDTPLTPPGTFSPATITASMARNFDGVESTEIDVDISKSHPTQPSLAFLLIPTSEGYKIDAGVLLGNAERAQAVTTLAEIRESKPSIEVVVLKMEKTRFGTLNTDFRVINHSKLHLEYFGFNLVFSDAKGGFVGRSLQNGQNLRPGATSSETAMHSSNVSLEEIGRISASDLKLTTLTACLCD